MKIFAEEKPHFRYTEPAPLNTKLLLLTKDNVLVIGAWKGPGIGENKTFKAWSGLPDRNKEVERKLGLM